MMNVANHIHKNKNTSPLYVVPKTTKNNAVPPGAVRCKDNWYKGRLIYIEGFPCGDLSIRKLCNYYLSYFLYWGSPSEGILPVRNPAARAEVMMRLNRADSEIFSESQWIAIDKDVQEKCNWKKSRKLPQEKNQNLRKENECRLRIQDAFNVYTKENGHAPGRNQLVKLAQCGRDQASRFLSQQVDCTQESSLYEINPRGISEENLDTNVQSTPEICPCRYCPDEVMVIQNHRGTYCPVEVDESIRVGDIYSELKHKHHFSKCPGRLKLMAIA